MLHMWAFGKPLNTNQSEDITTKPSKIEPIPVPPKNGPLSIQNHQVQNNSDKIISPPADPSNGQSNKEMLGKFKRVMSITNRIDQQDCAKMMKITRDLLLEKLFDWGPDLPFKIEGNDIVVNDVKKFQDGIDNLFSDCEDNEKFNLGKVE
jgi:hypothetical protein